MSALARLMIAGAAAALFSAPVLADEADSKLASYDAITAQQRAAATERTSSTCGPRDICTLALPAASLIRYDRRMDELLGH
jgi:hypothetical protein